MWGYTKAAIEPGSDSSRWRRYLLLEMRWLVISEASYTVAPIHEVSEYVTSLGDQIGFARIKVQIIVKFILRYCSPCFCFKKIKWLLYFSETCIMLYLVFSKVSNYFTFCSLWRLQPIHIFSYASWKSCEFEGDIFHFWKKSSNWKLIGGCQEKVSNFFSARFV